MAAVSLSKRGVGLGVALLLAALATAALVSYVRGVEKKTLQGAQTVEVYVAKDFIPAGSSGDAAVSSGLIGREAVPRKLVVPGVIASLQELRGRVATTTIAKGEQIVGLRFVSPVDARGGLPIPEGHQAASVSVAAPDGVAGFIRPGDHVSIMAHVDGAQGDESRVQFLLQNVQVLAVGSKIASPVEVPARAANGQATPEPQQSQLLLTLALRPVEAEQLAYAMFEGKLYFTLLPPGQKSVNTNGRTAANLFE